MSDADRTDDPAFAAGEREHLGALGDGRGLEDGEGCAGKGAGPVGEAGVGGAGGEGSHWRGPSLRDGFKRFVFLAGCLCTRRCPSHRTCPCSRHRSDLISYIHAKFNSENQTPPGSTPAPRRTAPPAPPHCPSLARAQTLQRVSTRPHAPHHPPV